MNKGTSRRQVSFRTSPLKSTGSYDLSWIDEVTNEYSYPFPDVVVKALISDDNRRKVESILTNATGFYLKTVKSFDRPYYQLHEKRGSKLSWEDAFEVIKRLHATVPVFLRISVPNDSTMTRFKIEMSKAYYDKEMDCIRFKKKLSSEEEEFDEDGFGGGRVTFYGIECAINREGRFIEEWHDGQW